MTALVLGLVACAKLPFPLEPPPKPESASLLLVPRTFKDIPGWKADDQSQVLAAFIRSCEKIEALPPKSRLGPNMEFRQVKDWLPICTDARLVRPGNETEAQYFFESRFTAYRASNDGAAQGLFTGYYEPELRGAWQPDPTYRYPIYARPKDLISLDLGPFRPELSGENLAGRIEGHKFVPYPTRADINDGVLKGKQLELLWVASAIDRFFLHVQGSGRVVFPDGSMIRVGFAGKNGRRYTPIGRELVAIGALPAGKVSLQSIQTWLAANPIAGKEIMERNKSYIFFRLLDGPGPIGSQGVVLTPGRSLAVDKKFIPLGVPVFLVTTQPGKSKKPLRRLVVTQDTGSAIHGPVRGDLFMGFGTEARNRAGRMREKGTYYVLLPKIDQPEPPP